MSNFISAVSWVPRGAAATPQRYNLDEDELKRVEALANVQLDRAKIELEAAKALHGHLDGVHISEDHDDDESQDEASAEEASDVDMQDASVDAIEQAQAAATAIKAAADPADLSIYNLDSYDDDSKGVAMGAFSNVRGLQYHQDNAEDPYITLKDDEANSDDEAEDLKILPTDNLLVAARTQDDVSQLDVYVYDDASQNLYIHHDLLLPAMPLALEWLSFTPASSASTSKTGNFVAVATMDPEIEIWNLDVLDGLYPDAILGSSSQNVSTSLETLADSIAPLTLEGAKPAAKKKKKKPKKPKAGPSEQVHTDAVLALSWNRHHPTLLASASADTTIKLWDLSGASTAAALRSYAPHANKVSAVQWNPLAPAVLLSGAWGGAIKVFDTRTAGTVLAHGAASDVECLRWNARREPEFLVGLENGQVQLFDSRMLGKAAGRLWTLDAHPKAVASLDYAPQVEGLLVTGGADKTIKLWNVATGAKSSISLVASRDLGVGNVFSCSFCPDDASTIAVAGSQGSLQVWDTACNPGVRQAFGDKLKAAGKDLPAAQRKGGGGVVGLNIDENEDTSDEE